MHLSGCKCTSYNTGWGNWEQFTAAVEVQFGTYDYKKAMNVMMALKQKGSVQEFYQEFLDVKYQLHMHNTALDETFFLQHFMKGLKEEIRGAVHSQDPDKLEEAVHLASIQEEMGPKDKFKPSKPAYWKSFQSSFRESKQHQQEGDLWKAR